jgi:hypothetical protein
MLVAENNAVAALWAHEATQSWASQFVYPRVGFSSGGASIPKCEPEIAALWFGSSTANLETMWPQFYSTEYAGLVATKKASGLPGTLDMPFAGTNTAMSNQLAAIASSLGVGMGTQGLQLSDVTNYYNGKLPGANNVWGNMLTYGASAPMFHSQLLAEDVIAGTGTGNITQLYPFIAQFRGLAPLFLETYGETQLCAYYPSFSDANCTAGNAPYAPYANALQYLAIGAPAPLGLGLARGH